MPRLEAAALLLPLLLAAVGRGTARAAASPRPGGLCSSFRASATGAGIQDFNRSGHLACTPAGAGSREARDQHQHRLVLFLPGTRLTPQDYTLFAASAAGLGFHVLSLNWPNWGCRPPSGTPTYMNASLFVASEACAEARPEQDPRPALCGAPS